MRAGAVPERFVKDFKICDLIEIDVQEKCPWGYQSENVYFNSMLKKGNINPKKSNLEKLIDFRHRLVFGSNTQTVSLVEIQLVDYSLMFIRPESFQVIKCKKKWKDERQKYRGEFLYHKEKYNLPITDLTFIEQYTNTELNDRRVYLTLSLGVKYRDQYWKLIAGVVCCGEK